MAAPTAPAPSPSPTLAAALRALACPFAHELSRELCASPGEARVQLLEWLVDRIDPLALRTVAGDKALVLTTVDRVRRLTRVLACFGFCGESDAALVSGATSVAAAIALVERVATFAAECASTAGGGGSGDNAVALLSALAAHQGELLASGPRLFPSDILLSAAKQPPLDAAAEARGAEARAAHLEAFAQSELRAAPPSFDEEFARVAARTSQALPVLRGELQRLASAAEAFNAEFESDLRRWVPPPPPPSAGVEAALDAVSAVQPRAIAFLAHVRALARASHRLCSDKGRARLAALARPDVGERATARLEEAAEALEAATAEMGRGEAVSV